LEGERAVRRVQVTALFDELVGLGAYMERTALDRLTGEGERYNMAGVTIDGSRRAEFLQSVKELPRVSVAIVKDSLVETFRRTTARNMLFFTGVLTVFAATIAVGIVYNSARIALAERAWELASLRVLGMTRAEVSTLFLGELALVLAAGIPLGFVLGYGLAALLVALTHGDAFQIPLVVHPRTYAYSGLTVVAAGIESRGRSQDEGLAVRPRNFILLALGIGAIAAMSVWALRPRPIAVETAKVSTGVFEQTIDDDGRTRVRDRYTVSAPLAGRVQRIDLRVGDAVIQDAVVAVILPSMPELQDPRTVRKLRERSGAAQASVSRAGAMEARATVALDQARSDAARASRLAAQGFVSSANLEQATLTARMREKELEAARFERQAAERELAQARAALLRVTEEAAGSRGARSGFPVRAPVSGRVLKGSRKRRAGDTR
jgi:biotin carboxyl carrier protein